MSAVERLRASMSLFEKCWPSVVRGIVAVRLGNLNGMAISVSYHRNLTHRAFKLPKWLEYSLAYCAAHAIQYANPDNVTDLEKQWFYRFMHRTYWLHPLALSVLLFAIGGVPYVIWGMGFVLIELFVVREVRSELAYNIYGQFGLPYLGKQPWNTGDLSKNNWMAQQPPRLRVFSEAMGMNWWEIDFGWYIIKFLQAIGLATCVKLPSQNPEAGCLKQIKTSPFLTL
ncbi:Palmitoyl-monogalactosyldiacylglycerol delta-7 desaturase, chloroplastic, partial [Cucurbita argyrosperma subsp. sororia]